MTTTTSKINFKLSFLIPPKNKSLSPANNNTMAILIRLLATRIVANSFLGFRSSFWTNCIFFESSLPLSSSKSEIESEKKAISAPEIKAEQNNKTKTKTILVISVVEIREIKDKLGGSISKMGAIGY